MADSGGIRAGQAYYELSLKDGKLTKGLRAWQGKMKAFGVSVRSMGMKIMGLGAALRAPFEAAEGVFASAGREMAEMSDKTGISVEALSTLKYAAEQVGVPIEELGVGLRKMQQKIGEAERGNKAAIDSFAQFGIAVGDLKGLSADKQMEVLADRISRLQDPAQRTAAAMELFGKSGAELLPLLNKGSDGIAAMIENAKKLGLQMSTEDAQAALKFSQALSDLYGQLKMVAFQVGAALSESMQEFMERAKVAVKQVIDWVKAHREAIIVAARVAAGILAAGVGMVAFGYAISIASKAIGGLVYALKAVQIGALLLLNPWTYIIAAIGGATYAFFRFTDAGQQVWRSVQTFIAPILQTFQQTFEGISDAISGGNIGLAAGIAIKGAQVAMLQGVAEIADSVGGAWGDFIGQLGKDLASGNLRGVWSDILSGLGGLWAAFSQSVVSVASTMVKSIIGLWSDMSGRIADFLQQQIEQHGLLAKIIDPDGKGAKNQAMEDNIARLKANLDPNKSRRDAMAMLPESEQKRILAGMSDEEKTHLDDKLGDRYQQQAADAAAAKASDAIKSQAKELNKALDAVQKQAEANTKNAVAGISEHGRHAAHESLDAAKRELAGLLQQAKDTKHAIDQNHNNEGEKGGKDEKKPDLAGTLSEAGTFTSMTAARQLGGTNDPTGQKQGWKEAAKAHWKAVAAQEKANTELRAIHATIMRFSGLGALEQMFN